MVRARQWDSALSDEYEQLHRSPAADFKQFRPGEKRPANRAGGAKCEESSLPTSPAAASLPRAAKWPHYQEA